MPGGQKTTGTQQLLTLLASKWTIPVIYALQYETLRYSAIEKALPNITQQVLPTCKFKRRLITTRPTSVQVREEIQFGDTIGSDYNPDYPRLEAHRALLDGRSCRVYSGTHAHRYLENDPE